MKAWPTIELPPVPNEFPSLKLKSTWGEAVERDFYNSYVCGITPYDATHLGHAATYLTFDLINRYQILRKKKLNFIENVTDVDDPLLERAKRDGVDWKELADSQTALFERDMTALHIMPPQTFLSVSETINLVLNGMAELEKRGSIYELDGDIYFSIAENLDGLPITLDDALKIFAERGGDPQRPGKRHPLDPLLWRKNIAGEPGWESAYGLGRPGWHIECAVIAIEGVKRSDCTDAPFLDLQGGGSDLIFPHHFMTKVIAERMTSKEFAAQYVHTGMLALDGEKMSKSRGNLVFVHQLLNDGIDPMVIRLALLSGKYSDDRMWSSGLIEDAERLLANLRLALSRIEVSETLEVIDELIKALANDLDTPRCLQIIDEWCQKSIEGGQGGNPGQLSRFLDSALGLAI